MPIRGGSGAGAGVRAPGSDRRPEQPDAANIARTSIATTGRGRMASLLDAMRDAAVGR